MTVSLDFGFSFFAVKLNRVLKMYPLFVTCLFTPSNERLELLSLKLLPLNHHRKAEERGERGSA